MPAVRTSWWCMTVGAVTALMGCSTGNPEQPLDGQPESDIEPSAGAADEVAVSSAGKPQGLSDQQTLAQRVQAAHPAASLRMQGDQVRRIYGRLSTGESPATSIANFRRSSAGALGLGPVDLSPVRPKQALPNDSTASNSADPASANADPGVGLMYNPDTGKYKFRLYSYQQQRNGVPVYAGGLRALVRTDGDNPVVWANTQLRAVGEFEARAVETPVVDEHKALEFLRQSNATQRGGGATIPDALTDFSEPQATVFAGVGEQALAPRMAVQYVAREARGPGMWTFVADAQTGDILHAHSIAHYDIDGSVEGQVTLGQDAMGCGPLGVAPLPYAKVSSAVGDAFTDASGAFTISESGSGSVLVTSGLEGEYFVVQDSAGPSVISLDVTPPGPVSFLHEDTESPPEGVLAQLNAYKQANEIRDMLLSYVPDYPAIATQTALPLNVNVQTAQCDIMAAWYYAETSARSLNFCPSSAERANGAYGSIVHHEYGHHIVDSGGSEQGEYGEGMGDTVALLFSKDPRMALGYYFDCNAPIRNADNDCQYDAVDCSSCGPEIHACGQLLSGTVWDIWQQLDITEPGNADDIIRSLVFNSVPLHMSTSIDASIAIDLLTLDDDDGVLENGTPHYDEICTGFANHGMDCPALANGLVVKGTDLNAEGPSDGPFAPASVSYTLYNVGPEQNINYSVSVPPGAPWLNVDTTSGSIALGEFLTVNVSVDLEQATALADGQYSAVIDFVNETNGVGNATREATLWVNAPQPIYTASFETGLDGFVPGGELDNLWHRSTACRDGLPGHSAPGSLYYGKDATCDYVIGTPIRHTITSPPITITEAGVAQLGLNYYLRTEDSPDVDHAEVLISVDGAPFEVVASNNSGGAQLNEGNAWQSLRFDISDELPSSRPTSIEIQFAFEAVSLDSNTKTGFVVDDVTVYAQSETTSSDPVAVPAVIQAEDYVRYSDTTPGNEGGGCDTGDDVDKEVTGDSAGGGCNVGWTDAGEWLEYDISVATAQDFDISARVASEQSGKSLRIEVDGVDVTGPMSVPANGWQSYQDVTVPSVPLSAGDHVVRVYMITNYINVNYIAFQASGTQPCGDGSCGGGEDCATCPEDCGTCGPTCGDEACTGTEDCTTCPEDCGSCSAVTLPAQIEAEAYDRYSDTTPGNEGGGCDTGDDVDKEVTGDSAGGGCNVGWTDAGEWLEYDVTVETAQNFDISARVASAQSGKSLRIEVDGVDVTGPMSVPANGWQSYQDVTVSGVPLSAGDHVVRVYMITNYVNINYISFQASGTQSCGDGTCDAAEDCNSCAQDCGTCQPACGDGTCDASEDCTSCAQDCGVCSGGCTCPSGCDAVVSGTVPFVQDGVDDTCYFFDGGAGAYINTWNMETVDINGLDVTNAWIGSASYPPMVNGGHYVYVRGSFPWSHVEVK